MNCKTCVAKGISFIQYHEGHDSYYCGICGEWLEEVCGDPECYSCAGRPSSLMINNEEELDWNRIMDLVDDPNFE